MLIHYHELVALTGVGKPGARVALDDLHKAAWSLYTGTGEHAIPAGTPRPFLFSADEVPSRPGVYLFKVRSAQAFPNAKNKSMTVEEGDSLTLTLRFKATANMKAGLRPDGTYFIKRRIVTTEQVDELIVTPRLSKVGLEALSITKTRLPSMPDKQRYQPTLPPIWEASVECVASDALLFADGWTRGVTHGKAYGFGMLQRA
jgi:hypothetical protein